MKKAGSALVVLALVGAALALPMAARATPVERPAPAMMGVREVILDYARFTDVAAADSCGLTREQVAAELAKVLSGSGVPAIPVNQAKPSVFGIARLHLIPEIATHINESLDCETFVSMDAENRVNAVIPPVATLRDVTVLYWRQRTLVVSSQSAHTAMVNGVIDKMTSQFAQQFRLDQPADLP